MAFMDFTRTALKNLFSKPATRQYPQVPREYPARSPYGQCSKYRQPDPR